MLFQKSGFPEEGELVLCTVTNILPNSVFAKLDEYGSTGMIHISEISPGRIRNINDFVKKDKKIVCVVLKIHEDRGHIDLSLRRVNSAQQKNKVENIKQLQKSEKIVDFIAKAKSIKTEDYFKEIINKISSDYDDLVVCFNDVVNENLSLEKYGISHFKELEETIKQRIKPPEVTIEGEFIIEVFDGDGVNIIKEAFSNVDQRINAFYKGGSKFGVIVKALNYKEADDILNPFKDEIIQKLEKKNAKVSYNRLSKKKATV
jgi:translation initiation factor 2 subunit 1